MENTPTEERKGAVCVTLKSILKHFLWSYAFETNCPSLSRNITKLIVTVHLYFAIRSHG
jgi:hypothetical protein